MKGKRYTEEQIIRMLRESEATSIGEVSRKHGVSEWSLYRWRKKYGDMDVSETKRLRTLEKENSRLKRIVAEQAMDIDAMKELLAKKW